MRKRYTEEQREQLLAAVRTGEKVAVVAAKLGVVESTAYQWVKGTARPESKPVFARVMPERDAASSSLRIEVGRATIRVESGFDLELLRKVIAALS